MYIKQGSLNNLYFVCIQQMSIWSNQSSSGPVDIILMAFLEVQEFKTGLFDYQQSPYSVNDHFHRLLAIVCIRDYKNGTIIAISELIMKYMGIKW